MDVEELKEDKFLVFNVTSASIVVQTDMMTQYLYIYSLLGNEDSHPKYGEHITILCPIKL